MPPRVSPIGASREAIARAIVCELIARRDTTLSGEAAAHLEDTIASALAQHYVPEATEVVVRIDAALKDPMPECEHVGYNNGCTTAAGVCAAGVCAACLRKLLTELRGV